MNRIAFGVLLLLPLQACATDGRQQTAADIPPGYVIAFATNAPVPGYGEVVKPTGWASHSASPGCDLPAGSQLGSFFVADDAVTEPTQWLRAKQGATSVPPGAIVGWPNPAPPTSDKYEILPSNEAPGQMHWFMRK